MLPEANLSILLYPTTTKPEAAHDSVGLAHGCPDG